MAHRAVPFFVAAAIFVAGFFIPVDCSSEPDAIGPGGVMYSEDGGLTWKASDLTGKWVSGVARDWSSEGHGFAVTNDTSGIDVWQTTNGGAHWSPAGHLPQDAGKLAYDILSVRDGDRDVLLVGTQQGLWLSDDGGKTWLWQQDLSSHPAWRLAAFEDVGTARVFVSLAVPGDERVNGLYSSSDLKTWRMDATGPFRVFESFDRSSVLAAHDLSLADRGTVFQAGSESAITLPLSPTDVSGAFDGSGPMIAMAMEGVLLSDDGGASWRKVADTGGNLAASPDFASSGLILIGGFRIGLFRSSDGGSTWQKVLADPSSVVPGINELSVTFLSPDAAVATNPPSRYGAAEGLGDFQAKP